MDPSAGGVGGRSLDLANQVRAVADRVSPIVLTGPAPAPHRKSVIRFVVHRPTGADLGPDLSEGEVERLILIADPGS